MARYAIVAMAALMLCAAICDAKPMMPPQYREMNEIVISKELTDAEKVKKLEAFLDNDACGLSPINHISRVDEAAARRIALAMFKKKNTPLKHTLELGKMLAKLGAVEAIKPMRKILLTHHDYWLRFYSARALGTLMQPPAAREFEAKLKADDDSHNYMFAWGQGLIDRGDDAGIEFMDFKYSTYSEMAELSSVTYMVEQRLPYIEKTRGLKAVAFHAMAFEYQPLRNILLFDGANVKYGGWLTFTDDAGKQARITNGDQALKRFEDRITGIYKRMTDDILSKKLAALSPVIAEIGKLTVNAKIREMSQDCVQALGK